MPYETLEADKVAEYVEQASVAIDSGTPAVVDYCPGNGTRYCLVFTPLSDPEAITAVGGVDTVVSLVNFQSAWAFKFPGYHTDGYVHEKLCATIGSMADAHAIAVLFNGISEVLNG